MGMFDHIKLKEAIKCECGLPHDDFQTKSFQPSLLDTYLIENGELLKKECTYREAKPEEQTEIKIKKTGKSIRIPLMVTEKVETVEMPNYMGAVNFYTPCGCGRWIEVDVLVDNGKVIKTKIDIRTL